MTGDQLALLDPPTQFEPGFETPPAPLPPDATIRDRWLHRVARHAHWVRTLHPDTVVWSLPELPPTGQIDLDQASADIAGLAGSPAWVVHARLTDIHRDAVRAGIDREAARAVGPRRVDTGHHARQIMTWVLARRPDGVDLPAGAWASRVRRAILRHS